uniref:Uncharacterized protein n=2 Tax=Brassica oleracea TaxID=3712 RepID=A0A0D3CHR4_BRAOL|nr:unnamed protein product [Brassica oleracea]
MASSSSRPSSYFLCNSDSLYYDDFIPAIEPEEILKADQIYFVLPVSKRHYRLTASDMAALAVKASVAMEKAVKNKNRRRKSGRISPVTMMNQPNERIVAVNRSSSTMMMQKGNLQNKTTQSEKICVWESQEDCDKLAVPLAFIQKKQRSKRGIRGNGSEVK